MSLQRFRKSYNLIASELLESQWGRYAFGCFLFAVAFAIRFWLLPMDAGLRFITFYPALIITALICGVGPALLVLLMCAGTGYYVFTPPFWAMKYEVGSLIPTLVFLLLGLLICWIIRSNRAAETKLSLLGAIIQSSDDAIVSKTLNGMITSWNPKAEDLFGFTANEAIGKPMTIVYPPDRLSEEDDLLARIAKGETISRYETVRIRKDGTPIDVSVTLSPIYNRFGKIIGASKIAHDIGNRMRAHAQLLAEQQLLQTTLDGLAEHVCMIDQTGTILTVNKRWIEFAQENGADMSKIGIGTNYLTICDQATGEFKSEAAMVAEGIRAVLRGYKTNFKLEYTCDSSSEKRWFALNVLRAPQSAAPRLVIVHHDITSSKQFETHLRDLAFHDPLTQLPNRRLLFDRLAQALLGSKRQGTYLAVLFLDLNRFKHLNDTYGHEAGDQLLIEVAHRLQDLVRDTDTVARIGGDEFVILLEDLGMSERDAASYADGVADKIGQSLMQDYILGEVHYQTTASIGIKLCLGDESDPDKILKDADFAMYQAKYHITPAI